MSQSLCKPSATATPDLAGGVNVTNIFISVAMNNAPATESFCAAPTVVHFKMLCSDRSSDRHASPGI
jgi:hypothetical protein